MLKPIPHLLRALTVCFITIGLVACNSDSEETIIEEDSIVVDDSSNLTLKVAHSFHQSQPKPVH